jgi:hypothetical protein
MGAVIGWKLNHVVGIVPVINHQKITWLYIFGRIFEFEITKSNMNDIKILIDLCMFEMGIHQAAAYQGVIIYGHTISVAGMAPLLIPNSWAIPVRQFL